MSSHQCSCQKRAQLRQPAREFYVSFPNDTIFDENEFDENEFEHDLDIPFANEMTFVEDEWDGDNFSQNNGEDAELWDEEFDDFLADELDDDDEFEEPEAELESLLWMPSTGMEAYRVPFNLEGDLTPQTFKLVPVETPGGGRIKDKREPASSEMVALKGYRGRRVKLHKLAAKALQAMIDRARQDGIEKPLLLPRSGYRSVARQQRAWKKALKRYGSERIARKWVAKPGSSPHHSGRAVDLYLGRAISSKNVDWMRKQPVYDWLVRNAKRYGFYPYQREPWHWEYNPPAAGQDLPSDPATSQSSPHPNFDVDRAVRWNRFYSRKLGWRAKRDSIDRFLGFANHQPNEAAFATAVASWQRSQNMKPDGMLGPSTWKRLLAALRGGRDRTPTKTSTDTDSTTTASAPPLLEREQVPKRETLYVKIRLGHEAPAQPMTGIFIPENYRPGAKVDLILYLPGHKRGMKGVTNDVSINSYWNGKRFPYWPLREGVNDSGKNAILVAPTLGPKSQAGRLIRRGGLDAYLDKVLAAIAAYSSDRTTTQPPALGHLILACHSGGGSVMRRLIRSRGRYVGHIRECWGFDCFYSSRDPSTWARWARSHPKAQLFVYYVNRNRKRPKKYSEALTRKTRHLTNVFIVPSSTNNHFKVPIAHWQERIQKSKFLSDR